MTVSGPLSSRVLRIEVRRLAPADDPRARALARDAGIDPAGLRVARVYLIDPIDGDSIDDETARRIASALLVDPVLERPVFGASEARTAIEVHPLPGVMDPAAQSVRDAIRALLDLDCLVSTAWRYEFDSLGPREARQFAEREIANPIVQGIHDHAYWPAELPRAQERSVAVREIPMRELGDAALERLSRDAHLFLSLDEMRAIREHYTSLGREPREIELETLAQTWSEHCVHKTLKSRVRYRESQPSTQRPIDWNGRPGVTIAQGSAIHIDNLLKSTVAAATHELIADGVDWTLSVFVDNAGVIAFDEHFALCMKVETHNHPSALEPYGGAATGIGGCIRDIIGTALGARPIANTDTFCVAFPDQFLAPAHAEEQSPDQQSLPPGCLHPRRILTNVVAGVRDYGNRMGIPTINGAVEFDNRYVGNPLVFCGCVGILPRDRVHGNARPGDLIVALGGRTGRDGIHGATFSSAELTDTHADEFSHAVQIGNAIEEKRLLDAILRARDATDAGPLFSAITDCGAGGFSSAIGEMGEHLGAIVHLDRAPLKYPGLTSTEIWISEAQERMILAVPAHNLEYLQTICDEEGVELAVLGTFGTPDRELILHDHGTEVGRLSMTFLHDAIPMPTREAEWAGAGSTGASLGSNRATRGGISSPPLRDALLSLLAHPTIASKHWIIRQYDHEVQGNTVLKPLVGPDGRGPGDAAVIEPVPGSSRGAAIACGVRTRVGDPTIGGDPYEMALGAIDECVRNLVCVGANPERIAILDNFCWPSCAKPENMGALVRACVGCYDGAKAYRTPFISGKDSLNNQISIPASEHSPARTIEIPYTLLISGLGVVEDLERCVTMDAKRPGARLVLVGKAQGGLGGSIFAELFGVPNDRDGSIPRVDLERGPKAAKAVSRLIQQGLALSVHDVSDGGVLVAIAEMLIAGSSPGRAIGAHISDPRDLWGEAMRFAECPSCYVVEVAVEESESGDPWARFEAVLGPGVEWTCIGRVTGDDILAIGHGPDAIEIPVEEMARAWHAPLDW